MFLKLGLLVNHECSSSVDVTCRHHTVDSTLSILHSCTMNESVIHTDIVASATVPSNGRNVHIPLSPGTLREFATHLRWHQAPDEKRTGVPLRTHNPPTDLHPTRKSKLSASSSRNSQYDTTDSTRPVSLGSHDLSTRCDRTMRAMTRATASAGDLQPANMSKPAPRSSSLSVETRRAPRAPPPPPPIDESGLKNTPAARSTPQGVSLVSTSGPTVRRSRTLRWVSRKSVNTPTSATFMPLPSPVPAENGMSFTQPAVSGGNDDVGLCDRSGGVFSPPAEFKSPVEQKSTATPHRSSSKSHRNKNARRPQALSLDVEIAHVASPPASILTWRDTVPDTVYAATSPQERNRQNAVFELVKTEMNFCHDMETVLIAYAYKLFECPDVDLSRRDYDVLFEPIARLVDSSFGFSQVIMFVQVSRFCP